MAWDRFLPKKFRFAKRLFDVAARPLFRQGSSRAGKNVSRWNPVQSAKNHVRDNKGKLIAGAGLGAGTVGYSKLVPAAPDAYAEKSQDPVDEVLGLPLYAGSKPESQSQPQSQPQSQITPEQQQAWEQYYRQQWQQQYYPQVSYYGGYYQQPRYSGGYYQQYSPQQVQAWQQYYRQHGYN